MVGLPIRVVRRQGLPRVRTYATVVGVGPRYKLGVHNNNLENVLRGLKERVYCVERGGELVPPPQPEPGVFGNLDAFAEEIARRSRMSVPWTYDEFILSYKGPKRTLYRQAVESLMWRGLERVDARLTTFVKAEKLDLESKPDPAPRVIQPRTPRYNAWVGRYLKAMEHRVYQAIDEVFGDVTVLSGYNALDVARYMRRKWDSFGSPIAVGLDASRFDQHVSVQALRWEHGVYNRAWRDRKLAEALTWQLENKGVVRLPEAFVRYSVAGKRMSGDMNTSMGNKLIMCALVMQYCSERGIVTKLANNGDDCVVFMDEKDYATFSHGLTEWFTRYGFTLKVEPPVRVFEQIEFCQQRPVFDGQVWCMTRSPLKGLAKDVMMLGANPSNIIGGYKSWAYGVGVAGLRAYGGMPVVQEVYKGLKDYGCENHKELDMYSGLGVAARRMKREYSEPTPQCRASYYLAWGIEPHAQVVLEEMTRAAFEAVQGPELIELVDHLSIPNLASVAR